jgi:hypothetical protein
MISPTELQKMDYAFLAQPFVDVPSKSSVNIETMDYVYLAQPFVRNYYTAVSGGVIKTVNGVAISGIKIINGINASNIKTINGLSYQ